MTNQGTLLTKVLVPLLLVSHLEPWTWAQTLTCTADGPCRCVMSDGSGVVDISSIGNSDGTARFPESPACNGDMFSYNPCFPSGVQECANAAVCQAVNNSFLNIGSQDSALWSYRVQYPIITYTSVGKKTEVMLICHENFTSPQLTVIGQFPSGTIGMMLTSRCACPGGCRGVEPTFTNSGALSAGYLALIIFFAVLGAYFIFGTSVNCVRSEKTGIELLPHYAFWAGLPAHILEGLRFTKHTVCCLKDERYQPI
ncbi:hypothetical protein BsWGS_00402 [Bradybaena similaris]